jgi:hypothetical protein
MQGKIDFKMTNIFMLIVLYHNHFCTDKECIIPDVPQTFHFGRKGKHVLQGQMWITTISTLFTSERTR